MAVEYSSAPASGPEPAVLKAVEEPLMCGFLRLSGQKSANPPASPGGGVKPGEAPSVTAERELAEETGLIATAERQLAVVRNSDRVEHYYLMRLSDPDRAEQQAAPGDLSPGQQLVWVDVALLPNTPLWPKRLAWRITEWSTNGWPDRPVELDDSIRDLQAPCDW